RQRRVRVARADAPLLRKRAQVALTGSDVQVATGADIAEHQLAGADGGQYGDPVLRPLDDVDAVDRDRVPGTGRGRVRRAVGDQLARSTADVRIHAHVYACSGTVAVQVEVQRARASVGSGLEREGLANAGSIGVGRRLDRGRAEKYLSGRGLRLDVPL